MKNVRFYIDPATGQPHIYGHNVDESDVEEALINLLLDEAGRKDSRVAIGRTRGGRCIKVIYSPDEDGLGLFVITAYDVKGKALAALRRRLRRRG